MLSRSAARGARTLVRSHQGASSVVQHPTAWLWGAVRDHYATAKQRDPTEAELEEARACLQLLMRASDRSPGAIRIAAADLQLDTVKDLLDATSAENSAEEPTDAGISAAPSPASTMVQRMSGRQTLMVALAAGVPAMGFGFLDNFIMIAAGNEIDSFFGAALGFSTMAAAGLGNLVSDVAGTGFEGVIERNLAVSQPKLTREQRNSKGYNRSRNWGKVFGIALGCLIGMFPLLIVLPRWAKARIDAGKRALGAEPSIDRAMRLAAEAEARLAAEAAWSAPAALGSDSASLLIVHRLGQDEGLKREAGSLSTADHIARLPRILVDPRLTAAGRIALPVATSSPGSGGAVHLATALEGVGGSQGGLAAVDDMAPLSRILSAAARSTTNSFFSSSSLPSAPSASLAMVPPSLPATPQDVGAVPVRRTQATVSRTKPWLDEETGAVVLAEPVRSGSEAAAVAAAAAAAGVRVCVPIVVPVRHADAVAASAHSTTSASPSERAVSPCDVWLDSILPAELDVLSTEEASGAARAVAELARGVLVFHPVGPGGGSFSGGAGGSRGSGTGLGGAAEEASRTRRGGPGATGTGGTGGNGGAGGEGGDGGGGGRAAMGFRGGDAPGVCAVLVAANWSSDLVAPPVDVGTAAGREGATPQAIGGSSQEDVGAGADWMLLPGVAGRRGQVSAAAGLDVEVPALWVGKSGRVSSPAQRASSSSSANTQSGASDQQSLSEIASLAAYFWPALSQTISSAPESWTQGAASSQSNQEMVRIRISAAVSSPEAGTERLERECAGEAHARRVAAARPLLPSLQASKALWALAGVVGPAVAAINGAKQEAALDEDGLQAVLLCSRHSLRGLAGALAATNTLD